MRIEFNQIAHLRSERLLVRRSGIGARNAQAAAQALIDEGCQLIVSWGFCGALADQKAGATVCTGSAIDAATDEMFNSSIQLPGTMISTNYAADRHQKLDLANSGAVAVDMESAAIARACDNAGVEFVVFRVVVDSRWANWASIASGFSNADLPAQLATIAHHPWQMMQALICIYRGKRALRRLSDKLEVIVRGF